VQLPSWDTTFGLPPIFEMNLPEGVLRERLRLAFAKATGTFDEFDLLAIVGRSQNQCNFAVKIWLLLSMEP
jgi:serine/threonine-protein kinase HipA